MVDIVSSYKAEDGSLHETLEQAVQHEVREELNSWGLENGYLTDRSLAAYLVEDASRRNALVKILEQLDE